MIGAIPALPTSLVDATALMAVLETFRVSMNEQRDKLNHHQAMLAVAEAERGDLRQCFMSERCAMQAALERESRRATIAAEQWRQETTASLAKLRRDVAFERAATRMMDWARNRDRIVCLNRFQTWERAVRDSRFAERRMRLMRQVSVKMMSRSTSLAWTQWFQSYRLAKEADFRRCRALDLFKSLLVSRSMKRGFRTWWEACLSRLVSNMITEGCGAKEICEAATLPYTRRAAAAAGDSNFDRAAREHQRAIVAAVSALDSVAQADRVETRCEIQAAARRVSLSHELRTKSVEATTVEQREALSQVVKRGEELIANAENRLVNKQMVDIEAARSEARAALEARVRDVIAALAECETRCVRESVDFTRHALEPLAERIDHEENALETIAARLSENERLDRDRRRDEIRSRRDADDALAAASRAVDVDLAAAWHCDSSALSADLRSLRGELAGDVSALRRFIHAEISGLPGRPHPAELDATVVAAYEEYAWSSRRVGYLPRELADTAACAARALGRHAAAAANVEELARLASGRRDDDNDCTVGPDAIAERRQQIIAEFIDELKATCTKARPTAGALRLEARARFLKRFASAAEAALTIYDQVIADAPTLFGRKRALPACVACNRPLPTKLSSGKHQPAAESYSQIAGLLASAWQSNATPVPAHGGAALKPVLQLRKSAEIQLPQASSSERATAIIEESRPKSQPSGSTALNDEDCENIPFPHGCRPLPRELDDGQPASPTAPCYINIRKNAPSHQHHQTLISVTDAALITSSDQIPQPRARSFRANKRLPPSRPKSAVRTGRALP